jgi:hypothetical protein
LLALPSFLHSSLSPSDILVVHWGRLLIPLTIFLDEFYARIHVAGKLRKLPIMQLVLETTQVSGIYGSRTRLQYES